MRSVGLLKEDRGDSDLRPRTVPDKGDGPGERGCRRVGLNRGDPDGMNGSVVGMERKVFRSPTLVENPCAQDGLTLRLSSLHTQNRIKKLWVTSRSMYVVHVVFTIVASTFGKKGVTVGGTDRDSVVVVPGPVDSERDKPQVSGRDPGTITDHR